MEKGKEIISKYQITTISTVYKRTSIISTRIKKLV